MGKYLKMADVLPNGVVISPLHSEIQQQYADHAINSHDELVAEVERLRYENSILRTRLETLRG